MGEVTDIATALGGQLTPPSAITAAHDVTRFTCGKAPLDDWLRQRALKAEGLTARTYVVCQGNFVVGYYAIAMGAVARDASPRKIKQSPNPIPAAILARLAVDCRFKGQRVGSGLLKDGLQRILQASAIIGSRTVLVHAIDEEALKFYKKYGFVEFPSGSQTLFLPVETIVDAL